MIGPVRIRQLGRSSGAVQALHVAMRNLSSVQPALPIPAHVPSDTKFLGLSVRTFIKVAEEASPFIRDVISCKVTHLEPGKLTMTLPFKPQYIGNPVTSVLHGGVAAALIDHVGGFCAMTSIREANVLLSTVDLRIDYINPAPAETMHCEAEVVSFKKSLIRSDIVCWNHDRTVKIAIGRALYSQYNSKVTLQQAMPRPPTPQPAA